LADGSEPEGATSGSAPTGQELARVANLPPDTEVMLPGGPILRGPEQVAQVVRSFCEALPDGKLSSENEVAAGDRNAEREGAPVRAHEYGCDLNYD
jgi:hypothetical protein